MKIINYCCESDVDVVVLLCVNNKNHHDLYNHSYLCLELKSPLLSLSY